MLTSFYGVGFYSYMVHGVWRYLKNVDVVLVHVFLFCLIFQPINWANLFINPKLYTIMKKFLIIVPLACLFFSSCITNYTIKTASTKEVDFNVTADLEIAQTKIRYKYVYNGGNISVAKENAINEALKMHGDADILVSPQYEINYIDVITEIIVSGFPAKYKNLRSISTDGTVFRTTKESLTEGCVISIPTEKPKLAISVKEENKEKKSILRIQITLQKKD